MAVVSPKEVRDARQFILDNGFTEKDIPARVFAITSKRMGKSYKELLKMLAEMKLQGQGVGQSPVARQYA